MYSNTKYTCHQGDGASQLDEGGEAESNNNYT